MGLCWLLNAWLSPTSLFHSVQGKSACKTPLPVSWQVSDVNKPVQNDSQCCVCKSRAFPWCLLGCALCPSAFKFGNCVGRLRGPLKPAWGWEVVASCKAGCFWQPRPCSWSGFCVISLLSFSPALSLPLPLLCQCLPCLGSFWVILRARLRWTLLKEPLCCRGLTAYPGVLRWLFCTFCGYSGRLNAFLFGFFYEYFGVHGGVLHSYLSS